MKKFIQYLQKPWLLLILLIVTVVWGMIAVKLAPGHLGHGVVPELSVHPQAIRSFAVSPAGKLAVNESSDDYSYLYCSDPGTGKMDWILLYEDLKDYCGSLSRYDLLFGSGGELYLHYVTWTEDQNAIQTESVLRLSADGEPGQQLCGIDYTYSETPPTRKPRMTAFRITDNVLHYVCCDLNAATFYAVDTVTGTQSVEGTIEWEGAFAGRAFALSDGYLLVLSDGSVCRASENGTLEEPLYSCSLNTELTCESDMFLAAAETEDGIYVLTNGDSCSVYALTDEGLDLRFSLYDLPEYAELCPGILTMSAVGDTLFIATEESIFQWKNDILEKVQTNYRLDRSSILSQIPLIVFTLLCSVTVLVFLIWLILIRKSLLVKQLMLMIPCITVIMAVLMIFSNIFIIRLYHEQQAMELVAVSELCRRFLDGDDLKRIKEETDTESYAEYQQQLLDFSAYNRGYWNGGLDFTLFLPGDEYCAYIYADSRRIDNPFSELDYSCVIGVSDAFALPDTDVCIYSDIKTEEEYTLLLESEVESSAAIVPVYAADGSVSAYLQIKTDPFNSRKQQMLYSLQLVAIAVPLGLLLLMMTTVISIIMSHSLRRATETVNKIADGDFTVRNHVKTTDEIGEICRQVDKMADNLNTLFAEKDANEQFYYKFVPEKFRELLGKEKITDLALGDAESREFTVLFCDIRSFSLNSEMLTAKENFEFVNIIYGIAGPIIRKHSGFVDKYIGDAVMALFESADSAVEAGMELYRAIVLNPATVEKLHVSEINIGIGIHTGMARIGIVGEDERLSGTVISDTVNLSSRLESLTKTYQTAMLLSKDTLDKMTNPELIRMRYLGMVQVAGVNVVKSIYEVLDCLPEPRRGVRLKNTADLREAVRLFHMGKRQEAVGILQTIDQEQNEDPIISMYLEYIRNMSEDDKGNVFRFVRK